MINGVNKRVKNNFETLQTILYYTKLDTSNLYNCFIETH